MTQRHFSTGRGGAWLLLALWPVVAEAKLPATNSTARFFPAKPAAVSRSPDRPPAPPENRWTPAHFARYDGILARMPFGLPPPPAALPAAAEAPPPPPPPFATKLTLCAINRTPMGSVAVGFTDASQNPVRSYYLDVGDTQDGFNVVSADFEKECAALEKDGVRVELKMGKGATVGMAKPVKPQQSSSPLQPAPQPQSDQPKLAVPPMPALSELPRLGTIQRPSQAGMPPVPGIPAAQLAESKRTREEIAKIKESGGDVSSYLARLRERRAQENEAKAAVEQAARIQMQELAERMTAAELAKREREINLNLIEQGARPISDITLTSDEENDLVQKGILAATYNSTGETPPMPSQ